MLHYVGRPSAGSPTSRHSTRCGSVCRFSTFAAGDPSLSHASTPPRTCDEKSGLGEVLQKTAHHLAFDRGPGAGTDINKSMSAIECQGGLVTFEHGKSDPRSLLFASPLKNRIGQ